MSRPTLYPRWATDGDQVVEPTNGQMDAGFQSGERVPPNTLNWLLYQIYLWLAYLGTDRVLTVHPTAADVTNTVQWSRAGTSNTSLAGAEARYPIQIDEGAIIKTLHVMVFGDGAADVTVQFFALNPDNTQDDLLGGTVTLTNPAAAWNEVNIPLAADHVVASGEAIYVRFVANAANISLGQIRVFYTPGPA